MPSVAVAGAAQASRKLGPAVKPVGAPEAAVPRLVSAVPSLLILNTTVTLLVVLSTAADLTSYLKVTNPAGIVGLCAVMSFVR